MVTEVGGDVDVGACRRCIGQEGIAGAAADGHGRDEGAKVSRDAHTVRGGRKPVGDPARELVEGEGSVQDTDAPGALSAIRRGGHQRHGRAHAESVGEGFRDSPGRVVGVGVGVKESDAVRDELVNHRALGRGHREQVRAPQQKRVMGDDQVGVDVDGLLHHGKRGVDREQDTRDRGRRVADGQPVDVPSFGESRRESGVEEFADVCDRGHGDNATGVRGRRAPPGAPMSQRAA
ncbi:hypothetical protein GCM10025876_03060 [Demequina litorisediminis]|uniref:Uncharacterized protein n=1 Tax=Demequina litorisediminis TaxID=1849022 RepID=A0ABQ6IAU9_9MICO|nr:hypothetical protein GCM10025876_03060 [Demequina litorisediminis]